MTELKDWLLENGVTHVAMESTGVYWKLVYHVLEPTSIKQVLSAKEVQYQLGKKHYSPVWLMMMKLRSIMGIREGEYKLRDTIEVDQAFFPNTDRKRLLV